MTVNSAESSPPSILQTRLHQVSMGGAEEQATEKAAGNLSAINWQDEALKVLENEVLYLFRFHYLLKFTDFSDGKILGEPSTIYSEHWHSNKR